MNLEQLSAEIEADEGCVLEVYLDHLGFPTVGVGHLVLESDEEWNKPVGTKRRSCTNSLRLRKIIQ